MIDKVKATYAEKSGNNWVVDEDDYNEVYEAYERLYKLNKARSKMIDRYETFICNEGYFSIVIDEQEGVEKALEKDEEE